MEIPGVLKLTVGAEVSKMNVRFFAHFEPTEKKQDVCLGSLSELAAYLRRQLNSVPPAVNENCGLTIAELKVDLDVPREIGAYTTGTAWLYRPLTSAEAQELENHLNVRGNR